MWSLTIQKQCVVLVLRNELGFVSRTERDYLFHLIEILCNGSTNVTLAWSCKIKSRVGLDGLGARERTKVKRRKRLRKGTE